MTVEDRWTWVMRAGVVMLAAGIASSARPLQDADPSFRPAVPAPAYAWPDDPRVVFDEGHFNVHTAAGRYRPFVDLLRRDGMRVDVNAGRITGAALRGVHAIVIVNPLGMTGLLQHGANLLGLERRWHLAVDAFDDEEIRTLAGWVHAGGAALIAADHAPAGQAARRLAAAFGVEMTTWWAEDPLHADSRTSDPAAVVFTRDNGLLRAHPITDGRGDSERVERVMTFTGQALHAPLHAAVLLRLSPSARQYPYRNSREREGRSAAGLAQAVALDYGSGRVVIIGEAAALTAQLVARPGDAPVRVGMNREGLDNQQFVLNIMHWLLRLL